MEDFMDVVTILNVNKHETSANKNKIPIFVLYFIAYIDIYVTYKQQQTTPAQTTSNPNAQNQTDT